MSDGSTKTATKASNAKLVRKKGQRRQVKVNKRDNPMTEEDKPTAATTGKKSPKEPKSRSPKKGAKKDDNFGLKPPRRSLRLLAKDIK